MGEVWRGHDEAGNVLAFKLLLPHFTSDPGVVARFMRERAILIRVQSPYVVAIHDLVAERGDLAIVMEFIEGSDLRRELQRRRTMPPTEAVGLMIDILAGLGAAHRLGIVHRDLKPENVLLDRSEERFRPKISDFGVAGLTASAATRLTIPGGMLGTPLYMAPESVDGGPIGPAADIYAAGTMLYEMLCGVAPFAGREMLSILRAHADLAPGRPIGIPDELWAVVVAMPAKNPDERPGVDRLQALLPGLVGLPALPPLRTPPSSAFSASYASYASSMASASSAAATVVIAGRPSGPAGPSGAGPAASAGSCEPVGWFTPSGPPSPGEPAVLAAPIDSADGEFDDPITTPVPVYLPVGAVSPGSGGLAPPGLPDRRSADPATPTAPAKAADLAKAAAPAKAAVPAEAPDMATTQVSARPAGAVQPGRVSASLAGSGKAPRSGPVGTGLPGESTGVPPVRRPPDPAGAGMTAGRSDESGDGTPDAPGRRRSRILAGRRGPAARPRHRGCRRGGNPLRRFGPGPRIVRPGDRQHRRCVPERRPHHPRADRCRRWGRQLVRLCGGAGCERGGHARRPRSSRSGRLCSRWRWGTRPGLGIRRIAVAVPGWGAAQPGWHRHATATGSARDTLADPRAAVTVSGALVQSADAQAHAETQADKDLQGVLRQLPVQPALALGATHRCSVSHYAE